MTAPTDDELAEMSKAWGVSVDRLRFLATCPHYDSKPHIRVDDYKDPAERNIAKAIREAIRGSWLPADAAKIGKVTLKEIEAFVCRHGIIWPPNCRPRLGLHGRNRSNLLANGRLTMAQAAAKGIAEGLTATETALKYNMSAPGMYNAAHRQGLTFISHLEKYGARRGGPTNLKAKPVQSEDPLVAEARASVELSLRNRPKA